MPTKESFLTVTDQFCGAGGSSLGATEAGLELLLALNHWERAIETHNANFPNARHDCTDISACDPRRYISTDLLITSPECTNHSVAKGQSRKRQFQPDLFGEIKVDPAEERSRATMWDVPRFAEFHDYRLIIVENVVDARQWVMWDAWIHAMDLLDYQHKCVYFNSMHAWPTPQSRGRVYVVFWKKQNKTPDLAFCPLAHCQRYGKDVSAVQIWKNLERRFGRYKQQYIYACPNCHKSVEPYYYCAANAIDWSLPAARIRDRPKPLKANTMKRIRIGLEKFSQSDPLIIELAFAHAQNNRSHPITEAAPTQTTRQTHGLVVPPFMVELRNNCNARSVTEAMSTICAAGVHHGVIVPPFLTSYYGTGSATEVSAPVPTVTTHDRHGLVVPPFILSYYTRQSGMQAAIAGLDEALPTQPTWPLHYLVQPKDGSGALPTDKVEPEDCGFRMLQPHEIQKAMAFPEQYIVTGTSREQVRQLGNAVTPPVMQMLIERCVESLT